MEDFLKIFGGTWVFSRQENLKETLEKMKMPQDDINFVMATKPTMTIERQGGKILHRTELKEDAVHDLKFELGKDKDIIAKDEKNDPPLFFNKVNVTFDGAKVKYICESQLTGPKKIDTVIIMHVKDGELISETSPLMGNGEPDTSIVGRRIYKKQE